MAATPVRRCLSDDLDLSRRGPSLHGCPFRCLALRGQPRRRAHQVAPTVTPRESFPLPVWPDAPPYPDRVTYPSSRLLAAMPTLP